MSNYLKVIERTKPKKTYAAPCPAPLDSQTPHATKATKAPDTVIVRDKPPCDKSDRSDKRLPNFIPLTVSEVLAEINRWGSGASKNAELYRRGELSEEKAVEYVACAILHCRRESFEVWRHHAPAVRKALNLCIHELESEECKVCNGEARSLVEKGLAK